MTSGPTLDDVCEAIVDCEHKTSPIDRLGDYWAVGTPAMREGRIDFAEARRINRLTFDAWTRRLRPRFGDLLLAREAPVEPIVRIPAAGNVAPGQRTVLLRPNPSEVDSGFLFFLLRSLQQQLRLRERAEGSTVAHLNVADVRTHRLQHLPPLPEQRWNAATLGALDAKMESNRRVRSLSQSLAQALFDDLVTDVPPTPLREVLNLRYGKALPAAVRQPGPVPVLGSGGVTGSHSTALVDGPAVVVGRKGTVGALYW